MKRIISIMFTTVAVFVMAGCATPDSSLKVTTSSAAANSWLHVQVDPTISPDSAWQKLVDSVTGRYSSLEMMDITSGYMRSVYVAKQFVGPQGRFAIHTRFIGSISTKTPLTYKIKIESETARVSEKGKPIEAWQPIQRIFTEDEQLVEEIQSRLAVK